MGRGRKGEKAYTINFIPPDKPDVNILKNLARRIIQKVLDQHGAVCHNLEEVLDKYITLEAKHRANGA